MRVQFGTCTRHVHPMLCNVVSWSQNLACTRCECSHLITISSYILEIHLHQSIFAAFSSNLNLIYQNNAEFLKDPQSRKIMYTNIWKVFFLSSPVLLSCRPTSELPWKLVLFPFSVWAFLPFHGCPTSFWEMQYSWDLHNFNWGKKCMKGTRQRALFSRLNLERMVVLKMEISTKYINTYQL